MGSTLDPVYEYIKARVYNVPFPKRWTKEGIAKPNVSAIENTKEEGLGIERHKSKRSLVIEVYNDLDVGGLVNDNLNKRLQAKFS